MDKVEGKHDEFVSAALSSFMRIPAFCIEKNIQQHFKSETESSKTTQTYMRIRPNVDSKMQPMFFTKDDQISLIVLQLMNPRFSCLIAPASQFKKESNSSYEMSDQIFSLLKGIDESNI